MNYQNVSQNIVTFPFICQAINFQLTFSSNVKQLHRIKMILMSSIRIPLLTLNSSTKRGCMV